MNNKTPTLSFNRTTNRYEGWLHVEVDPEIFKRMLLLAFGEDAALDLTDPQALMPVIARVGNISKWIGHPHAKVTPIAIPTDAPKVASVAPLVKTGIKQVKQPAPKRKTLAMLLEERLRETAQHIAPHLWDTQCVTPIADMSLPDKVRADVGRLRSDERKVLRMLREEWEQGVFVLDSEATEQERQYQESQQTHLAVKLEAVAEAVNGNKFR